MILEFKMHWIYVNERFYYDCAYMDVIRDLF